MKISKEILTSELCWLGYGQSVPEAALLFSEKRGRGISGTTVHSILMLVYRLNSKEL